MRTSDLKILTSHPIQYQAPIFRRLAARGLDVDVVFFHRGAAGQEAPDADFGLTFQWDVDLLAGYTSRALRDDSGAYSLQAQAGLAPGLLRWALANPAVPLLMFGWFAEVVWLLWLLRTLRGAPTIVMCETTPQYFTRASKPAWRVALLRSLLRRAAAGIYIGSGNRRFLVDGGVRPDVLFPAPYSVDNARLEAEARRLAPERRALCLRHGLDPDLPTFLAVGKLVERKQPLGLLEAYLEAGLDACAQLLYVGDGPLREALAERARARGAGHVHVLGFLNQSRLPVAYVLGEVLCLPSSMETWGLVVNEALACGRPAIVSDAVGCGPDLVTPDNGWVVPAGDVHALARCLGEAHARRGVWEAMGRRGRDIVSAHTFDAMADGIVAAMACAGRMALEHRV